MSFCVNEFEVGVNDNIFSGNEQQKVYLPMRTDSALYSQCKGNHEHCSSCYADHN